MSRGAFVTAIAWNDGEDDAEVRVVYSTHKGSPQTLVDPEELASIEIVSITPLDPTVTLPPEWTSGDRDEELYVECSADRDDEIAEAAEWRAQSRRDDLLMERF